MEDLLLEVEQYQESEQYVINNDLSAEKAIRIIKSEKDGESENNRLIKTCKDAIAEYEETIKNYEKKKEKRIAYYQGLLQKYFESVEHKKSKAGNESYELPSGKLWLKKLDPDYKRDDEKFVQYLKQNGFTDYVESKETPKWGEFKKTTKVFKGEEKSLLLDQDGNVVGGVEVIERDPEFEVKI